MVWITDAMTGAAADLDVLLRRNAVNYAVKGQDASGLSFGARTIKNSAHLAGDVAGLIGKGVELYIVADDLADRGLGDGDLIDGLKRVSRADIPGLLGAYDQVWHW